MTIDSALMGQLNQLKGLILQVKQNTDSLSTDLPEVDFCCDMFDRADSPILSGYWDGAGITHFVIRGGQLIQQSPTSASRVSGTTLNIVATASSEVVYQATIYAGTSRVSIPIVSLTSSTFYRNALYKAYMRSSDMHVKVSFDLSSGLAQSRVVTNPVIASSGNLATLTTDSNNAVAASFGGCFSNASGNVIGMAGYVGFDAGLTSTSTSAVMGPNPSSTYSLGASPYSIAPRLFGQLVYTDTFTIFENAQGAPATVAGESVALASGTPGAGSALSVSSSTLRSNPEPPFTVGSNTLRIVVVGDTYDVYVNGATWFSRKFDVLPKRSRVGILVSVMNQLSEFLALGLTPVGITSFKAWPVGKLEPLDETGHGVYDEDLFVYTDRYHDSDGNYNPEA